VNGADSADAHSASNAGALHGTAERAKQPAGQDQDQKKRQHKAPH